MDTNKLIGLGILAIGGYLIYSQFVKKGVDEMAADAAAYVPDPMGIEDAAAVYAEAGRSWDEVLDGEPVAGGRLFRPLDISSGNPLRLYYAVVKARAISPLTGKGGSSRGVYLFNPNTQRETSLDQLAKSESMTADARRGVEETFAHAFAYACDSNRMDQWTWRYLQGPPCSKWEAMLTL